MKEKTKLDNFIIIIANLFTITIIHVLKFIKDQLIFTLFL